MGHLSSQLHGPRTFADPIAYLEFYRRADRGGIPVIDHLWHQQASCRLTSGDYAATARGEATAARSKNGR
jgi:hypothetical protein